MICSDSQTLFWAVDNMSETVTDVIDMLNKLELLQVSIQWVSGHCGINNNNNNNNAIYIAQIRAQQQMGCRMISVQTERLSA